MNRFEQLIEYVINDEEQKARELFHDIVVEKSRQIYEDIMSEEAEEELDEGAEEELDEGAEEELDEGDMGGDASDDLIDEVEAEEESDMSMEAEEEGEDEEADFGNDGGDDFGGDEGGSGEPATKDDIMNLEDKLDQLMAEFEDLMGDEGGADMGDGDGFGADEGGDAIEMDDTEEMEVGMMEGLDLKAAPKPVTSEEGSVNKKSTVAANAGAKGPIGSTVKPVHTGASMGGHHDTAAYKNTTKEVGVTPTQEAGKKAFKSAAPAPVKTQASGVNTKSVIPSKHN
jgi:hypothetical protein